MIAEMMRLLNKTAGGVVLLSAGLLAQHDLAGTRAFEFLQIDYNARTVSMGGAAAAMPNGLYGASVNPAVCGFIEKKQAMLGYEKYLLDTWAGPMGYAMPYRGYGVFAASLIYMSHCYLEGEEALDEAANVTGAKWHLYSLVGNCTWAKIVYPLLSIGLTMKGIHHSFWSTQEYNRSAQAIAFDGGAQYRALNSRLILGVAFQNAGFIASNYSVESLNWKLPFSGTLGISYTPLSIPGLRLACDLQKASDDYLNYKPGIEVAVYKEILFVRGGYGFSEQDLESAFKTLKNEPNDNYIKSNFTGLSLGLGYIADIKGIATNVDVAYLGRADGVDPAFLLTLLFEY
jgi:hypothetical protein